MRSTEAAEAEEDEKEEEEAATEEEGEEEEEEEEEEEGEEEGEEVESTFQPWMWLSLTSSTWMSSGISGTHTVMDALASTLPNRAANLALVEPRTSEPSR